jgi:hypothetical protein
VLPGVRPQAPSTQPAAGAYGGQTYAFPAEQPAATTTATAGEGQLVVAADSTRSSSIAADKAAAASAAAAAAARRQSTAAAATAGKRQSLTGRADGGNTGSSSGSGSGSSVLRAGRLTIKCIAAHGVRSKAGAALEASVRITLGAVKAALVSGVTAPYTLLRLPITVPQTGFLLASVGSSVDQMRRVITLYCKVCEVSIEQRTYTAECLVLAYSYAQGCSSKLMLLLD